MNHLFNALQRPIGGDRGLAAAIWYRWLTSTVCGNYDDDMIMIYDNDKITIRKLKQLAFESL